MSKKIYITPEANKQIELKKYNLEGATLLTANPIETFEKTKNPPKEIHIYDAGFNSTNTIIPIINHINKTGINPLRNNNGNIDFYDITKIYQQQNNGKIAECFGSKKPPKKNKKYIQAHFLCNYIIAANYVGIKKIYAYVIN